MAIFPTIGKKLEKVFVRLSKAGLKLDLKKCEYAIKSTKYLGFIICLVEGMKVDPDKVKALKSWSAPTIVKVVHSLFGFANF